MGNCMGHESAVHWGGDDWGSMAGEDEEPVGAEGLRCQGMDPRSPPAGVVIRVRVTRRQLEELLLGRAYVKELPAPATQLLTAAAGSLHRPWRPALQSIPEAD